MRPEISIIVPCYNQAEYLDEALESVFKQTFTNWECIIVNDGSTDDTSAIARSFLIKDKRFKYIEQENRGVSKARNQGILIGKGEFILPLDADDKISSNYLQIAINRFNTYPNTKLIYCNAEKFGEEAGKWHLPPFSLKVLAKQNIIFSSAIYRKVDWEKIGGYDENMFVGLEDWEFWISLLKHGGEVQKIDEVCFFYRIKRNSRNKNLKTENFEDIYKYLSIKHAEFFVNQLGSFIFLYEKFRTLQQQNIAKLKSEKFVIKLFFNTFFRFPIFKKEKENGKR